MAQYRHVMFGHVLYEDGFSYQELLDAEERIRAERERDSLARAGAFDRPDTGEERLPDTAAPASERQSPEQAEHRLPRTEPDEFFD